MRILGWSKSLPEKILTNNDLEQMVDTSDEWIVQRTGIEERRVSNVNNSDLACDAAEKLFEKFNIDKDSIDLIICATSTGDNYFPSVACLVQEKLNIKSEVTSFDLNAACSGFIYALKVAGSLLQSYHKRALVIGVDIMSKIVNYKDRDTCILFGDGAGAVVVEKDDKQLTTYTRSLGEEANLFAKGRPLNSDLKNSISEENYIKMNGKEVFKFAVSAITEAVEKVVSDAKLTLDNIKLIVPHQANKRIIDFAAKKLNVAKEKFFTNINKYGNTSSASVPIALSEVLDNNAAQKGDKIILVGFGAGLTWGAILLEL